MLQDVFFVELMAAGPEPWGDFVVLARVSVGQWGSSFVVVICICEWCFALVPGPFGRLQLDLGPQVGL